MRVQRTLPLARFAIVSLAFFASLAPCSPPPVPVVHAVQQSAPRALVADPMVWMVPTEFGWQPAELAQPTLWIEGQPHTRMVIERPGVERALYLPR